MLPGELLITKVKDDTISPRFMKPDVESIELAENIIAAFKDHTGRKFGELDDILEEMEDQGFDYRQVRGLVALLERRCDMRVEAAASPEDVRRAVFGMTGRPATSPALRQKAIVDTAAALGISAQDVEASMFADLERELVIRSCEPLSAAALIYEYNLSMAQTMLFKATELRFTAPAGHKEVLRAVKYLGLMYDAKPAAERLEITIEGPLSAIKFTDRYGTSLAKLLPHIVASPGWNMDASIIKKDFTGQQKVYGFSMSWRTHDSMFGKVRAEEAPAFDSEAEARFYDTFANANTGWSIVREPEPLVAGKYLYIPDFLLEKAGKKVYVEIAGFWTPEYMQRKAAKLKDLKEDIIVIADARASCGPLKDVGGVILYDKRMQLRPVLDRLKAYDSRIADEGLGKIEAGGIKPEGDVATIESLASKAGVSTDAVKLYLEKHEVSGYVRAGDELIKAGVLEEIKPLLKDKIAYGDAAGIITSKGIASVDSVLGVLGYGVKWLGLDSEKAVIYRAK